MIKKLLRETALSNYNHIIENFPQKSFNCSYRHEKEKKSIYLKRKLKMKVFQFNKPISSSIKSKLTSPRKLYITGGHNIRIISQNLSFKWKS